MNGSHRIVVATGALTLMTALLLSIHANHLQDTGGLSPSESLAQAIDRDDISCVTAELEKVDVNSEISSRATPLMIAALGNHVDMATLFIEHGADVNYRNVYGWSALHAAASRGNAAMVDFLLQHGAKPNLLSKGAVSPLILAARAQSTPVVCCLLRAGANPRQHDALGETPQIAATRAGDEELADLLCAADPTTVSPRDVDEVP
jgi:ankyrin repeat protein